MVCRGKDLIFCRVLDDISSDKFSDLDISEWVDDSDQDRNYIQTYIIMTSSGNDE